MKLIKMISAADARKVSDKNKQNKLIEELENIEVGIRSQSSRGSFILARGDISEEAKTILIQHGYEIEKSEEYHPGITWIISW